MVYRGGSIGGDFKKADDRVKRRNDWLLVLVRESQIAGDAWIISSPGSDTVLVETLTTSAWPDELRGRGYPLREVAGGTRILPHAFHQPMEQGANGKLVLEGEAFYPVILTLRTWGETWCKSPKEGRAVIYTYLTCGKLAGLGLRVLR